MANTIIHKQSSVVSKVPLSGVLSLGELAVNTADGKVFMKKSDNSVVEVGSTPEASEILTLIKTVDGTGSGLDADLLDGNDTAFFAPQSDTHTKAEIASMHSTILSGIDWKEAVTNFADLATTHTSPQEGWTASVNAEDTVYRYDGSAWIALANGTVPLATAVIDGKLSSSDYTKLQGGSGSGLNADMLQGADPSDLASNSTIVKRTSSGYIRANYFNTSASSTSSTLTSIYAETNGDGYIRKATSGAIKTFIGIGGSNTDYNFSTILSNSSIPVGFSRIYTSNSSPLPGGSHATGVTFKSLTSRGFQLLCDDIEETGLYFRNQSVNGSGWTGTHNVMLHVKVTSATNIDNIVEPGMYVTKSNITNYPGNRSNITLQVQVYTTLIQQQVFNDTQMWLRRSIDTGSTWSTWSQH